MNWIIILVVLTGLVVLRRFKLGMLAWLGVWWFAALVFVRFGFDVAVPMSVVKLYMGIVSLGLMAYVLSDRNRLKQVQEPLVALLTERSHAVLLGVIALAIPSAVAANIYFGMTAPAKPPVFGRTVHPAPPTELNVFDKEFDLVSLDNPYRHLEEAEPEEFATRVAHGREVYYENCFYCHGDLLAGDGMFIHGLNPIPTNFQDQGTLPILQESFVFWRITKGAPGLPEEGGPWASAMPAWEKFLNEDEVWDVILFIYDFTGARPRARHEVDH